MDPKHGVGLVLHPANDMEVTIANHHSKSFDFIESKNDKVEFKGNIKFSKNSIKEVMSISTTEPI